MSCKIRRLHFPHSVSGAACILFTGLIILTSLSPAYAEKLDFKSGWDLYQQGQFTEAFDVWKPLANAGDAQSQFNLAVLYERGRGVEADSTKAVYWNNRAVELKYPPALHNLALSLLTEKRNVEAVQYLLQAADRNFAASQYTLGKIHQFGIGTTKDPARAFQYIETAANSGLVKAQYNLGKMYRDGYGTSADDRVSAEWFEIAANRGYGKAQNSISTKYGLGQGVARDEVQALKWAILAARNGVSGGIQKEEFFRAKMTSGEIQKAESLAEAFRKEN